MNTPAGWSERALLADPYETVRWSREGQQERHIQVIATLDPEPGETLLDYGCGLGALTDWLPAGVEYLGYDWSLGMVQRARRERPGYAFTVADPLHGPRSFDLTACVGPFNLRDNWSKAYTWKTLDLLWRITRRALAASLYAGTDRSCLQYEEQEVDQFARTLSAESSVSRWRENDVLLVIAR